MKKNNKGFTLVELLVAIGIGATVSAAIASLLVISLRMYNNESVNAGLQYDLQTSLNQVMDSSMASSGLVLKQKSDGTGTEYAILGHFGRTKISGGTYQYDFYGEIFYADSAAPGGDGTFTIYMNRIPESAKLTGLASPDAMAASQVAVITANPKQYVLSKNVTNFKLECKSGVLDTVAHKFTNPVTLNVNLDFKQQGTGKEVNKRVEDQAVMRNRVKVPIVVDGVTYAMKE